jgi:hypothetical protein
MVFPQDLREALHRAQRRFGLDRPPDEIRRAAFEKN